MEQNLVEVENLLKDATKKLHEMSHQKQKYEELIAILCKDRNLDESDILNKLFQKVLTKDASNQTNFDKLELDRGKIDANEDKGLTDYKDLKNKYLIEDIRVKLETEKAYEEEKISKNSRILTSNKQSQKNMEHKRHCNDTRSESDSTKQKQEMIKNLLNLQSINFFGS